jgi:hypothetical protein
VATLPGLPPADVDINFYDDIRGNINLAGNLVAEARKGRFGLFTDILYSDIETEDPLPYGILYSAVDTQTKSWIVSIAGLYRLAELAQELSNPLADLMTIPIQMNYDRDIGPLDDGWKLQTNIQPVIPIEWGDNWNLITRTIMPVISQNDIAPGTGSQFGLGDINLSLFFSPREPTSSGLIWGVGPVLLLPTATDSLLGAKKWGAGPAGVALTMRGPWTMGILANHVWSYAGDSDRQDISNTFAQPFLAYTWPSA